jgi:hypothetical protein
MSRIKNYLEYDFYQQQLEKEHKTLEKDIVAEINVQYTILILKGNK